MRILAAGLAALLLAGCAGGDGGSGPGPGVEPAGGFALADFLSTGALDDPVFLTHAGDGSGRLFIVEQKGLVRVWDDGRLKEDPFLDLAAGGDHPVVLAGGERGLLGLAFHPGYKDNGRLFVYYTGSGGALTIAQYRNPQPGDDAADPASGQIVLVQEHAANANHNGGMLAFGPDGFLYAGLGDGGGSGDAPNNAQDLQTLLGKVVRLDVDGGCGQAYCVPGGNPLVGREGRDEIWDWGLRNPWRFSFDRDGGDLWIGDVGQNAWEEVDHEPAGTGGHNYGWSRLEGSHVFRQDRQVVGAIGPVAEYSHGWGGGSHCAVTGGYVYRGAAVPGLQGTYLFGDYCSGFLWTLKDGRMDLAHDTGLNLSSFGEDEAGELYVVDHGGAVKKVVPA